MVGHREIQRTLHLIRLTRPGLLKAQGVIFRIIWLDIISMPPACATFIMYTPLCLAIITICFFASAFDSFVSAYTKIVFFTQNWSIVGVGLGYTKGVKVAHSTTMLTTLNGHQKVGSKSELEIRDILFFFACVSVAYITQVGSPQCNIARTRRTMDAKSHYS